MKYPRIRSAVAVDDHTLVIEFDNEKKKRPLLKKDMFSPLKNPAFFKAVSVDQGGHAVVWGSDIDLSEYELWRHGELIQQPKRAD